MGNSGQLLVWRQSTAEIHDMRCKGCAKKSSDWRALAWITDIKPAANDLLQRWPVSKRVNSSRAPDEDSTLIDCSML